jgi:hypothetical protein
MNDGTKFAGGVAVIITDIHGVEHCALAGVLRGD